MRRSSDFKGRGVFETIYTVTLSYSLAWLGTLLNRMQ